MDRCGYSKVLGFSLVEFLTSPVSYVKNTLKINIFKFKNIKDCIPIGKSITYFTGSGFEKSLYGSEQVITEEDAWVSREPVFTERVPIDELPQIDFYNNSTMKEIHNFYDSMCEIVDDDFTVEFPVWNRSAWGLAWHLRGIDALIYDYIEDSEWLKDFLEYLNAQRINWETQRCKHFGTELLPGSLYNDEVVSPVISPELYENIILPSEIRTAQFYGILNYWHSCGNTTPFMDKINTIPNLRMVHVSGWSDYKHADEVYDKKMALQFALNPVEDVLQPPSLEHLDNKLHSIVENSKNRPATVMLDAVQMLSNVDASMKALYYWIDRANEILLA